MKYIEQEIRPWGKFYVIHDEKNYKIKRIEVKPGHRLSYQYHLKRSESWTVVEGKGRVTINGKDQIIKEGETLIIPVMAKHRIMNNTDSNLVFIEVQTGTYFGEDDIVRLTDDYKRS